MDFKKIMNTALVFSSVLLSFLAIDAIWIGVFVNPLYKEQFSDVLLDNALLIPALLFYVIYVSSLYYLVIRKTVENGLLKTVIASAVFGLASYSTYALTNYAVFKGWTMETALIDIAWGIFISVIVSVIGRYVKIYMDRIHVLSDNVESSEETEDLSY